jgi:hypothetical protein
MPYTTALQPISRQKKILISFGSEMSRINPNMRNFQPKLYFVAPNQKVFISQNSIDFFFTVSGHGRVVCLLQVVVR